jgi:hypothetical protein
VVQALHDLPSGRRGGCQCLDQHTHLVVVVVVVANLCVCSLVSQSFGKLVKPPLVWLYWFLRPMVVCDVVVEVAVCFAGFAGSRPVRNPTDNNPSPRVNEPAAGEPVSVVRWMGPLGSGAVYRGVDR